MGPPMNDVIAAAPPQIDSTKIDGLNSDRVLSHLRLRLEGMGFRIERGRKADFEDDAQPVVVLAELTTDG